MPDSLAASVSVPAEISDVFPMEELLTGVLDASLTGIGLFKPIRAADSDEIIDFDVLVYNAAAQHITGQAVRPGATYLQMFPHALQHGVFAFLREAFESGQPARMEINYQADGLDNYFRIAAQRVGQGLVLSFRDPADESRTAV
jgi:hypothetical protein